MGEAQLVADLTSDVVVAAFIASVLFVAVYSTLAKWWETEVGRALVTLDAGLALTLGPSVGHRLFGFTLITSAWFSWYYLASLTLVAVSTLWRTWIVAKTQWRARHRQGAHE